MRFYFTFILLLLSAMWGYSKPVEFQYYSEKVVLEYDTSIILKDEVLVKAKFLKLYYEKLSNTKYQNLLQNLKECRDKWKLNDWLFCVLLRDASKAILYDKNENQQVALCWFLLNESGITARLGHVSKDNIHLYILSKTNLIQGNSIFGHRYVHLKFTTSEPNFLKVKRLNYPRFNYPSKVDFSIHFPVFFKMEYIQKKIYFFPDLKRDSVEVILNKTILDIMSDYPILNWESYFSVDFSESAYNSLIPFFRKRTEGMTKEEAIRYVLAFISTGFAFENDRICYGKEKPMIAEEVFYYPFSDCEDKAALFLKMIKELIDIDVLILQYPRHITTAVLLDKVYGDTPFIYNDKVYSTCETNLIGDFEGAGLGYYTPDYFGVGEVIYEYHPKK